MEIIFQSLEIIFGYLGAYSTKKKNIFTFYVLGTIFSALMFWSVGSYAAILPVLTTGIRYFVFIFKDKYKTELPLIFCLIIHFIVLFVSAKTVVEIIPSALVIIGCLVYWYLDKEKLKMGIFILNIPWIFYYIYCGLYLTALNATIQTVLVGIAFLTLLRKAKMKKIFLSLNNQFFNVKPKELVNLVKRFDKSKLIYGFEIAVTNKEEEKYVIDLAKIAYKKGYKINLHSLPFEKLIDIENYINYAVELSKITNDKINIVYHPVESQDYKKSVDETNYILNQIFSYIEDKKYSKYIDISIENLNDLGNLVRLKKEDLIQFLNEKPNLKFTYDIGHETVDNIYTNEIETILKERLNNIHIHSHRGKTDHYPIKEKNNEKELFDLLTKYGKKQNIVMEYGIDYIDGNDFEQKLKNYINYAKII